MDMPQFDSAAMAGAAQKIDAVYMDELMNAIIKFAREGGAELGLNESQISNVLASACALVSVNIEKPKDCDQALFNTAMKEAIPRLYDAMFSLRDWFDRRAPWRMQSTHMKRANGRIVTDLREINGQRLDS